MATKFIVNADDFGRTHSVSEGILRAHKEGIVTSTTAMMNMPGVAHDLQRAKAEAPDLGIGVHLNFTAGRPLLPVEWVGSLVNEQGHLLSQEVIQANPTRLDPDELKSELKSQINTFNNVMGRAPDHLDVHHFVHIHPHLFAVYLDLATEFNLPIRVPFPRTAAAFAAADGLPGLAGGMSKARLEPLLLEDWRLLAKRTVRSTDHCQLGFYGEAATLANLLGWLDALPDGVTELMTHPGLADDVLRTESGYSLEREQEMAILTHTAVKARIRELDIELVTFAALKA